MELYSQCLLSKDNCLRMVWIPTRFAKKDKIIECKVNGKWVNGWTISEAYHTKLTRKELDALYVQYKDTRKASDI